MKQYKKPEVEIFELRSEEKIAAATRVKVNGALVNLFDVGQSLTSAKPEVVDDLTKEEQ